MVMRLHYRAAPQPLLSGRRGWPASIDGGRSGVLLDADNFFPFHANRDLEQLKVYPCARSCGSLRASDGERPVQRLKA
jgi:hypothetical protein